MTKTDNQGGKKAMSETLILQKTFEDTCDIIDCNNKAIREVKITLTNSKEISLFLCHSCIPKFQEAKRK